MRLNSKQKIELAVILILFLVLFTIPMIAEIHYQTFYYLFVTTIFPLSMYFFNREVKMSDEALFQKMKRKKERGLVLFLVIEWIRTIVMLFLLFIFGKMIDTGIPFMEALKHYASHWLLLVVFGTVASLLVGMIRWSDLKEKYVQVDSRIRKRMKT